MVMQFGSKVSHSSIRVFVLFPKKKLNQTLFRIALAKAPSVGHNIHSADKKVSVQFIWI